MEPLNFIFNSEGGLIVTFAGIIVIISSCMPSNVLLLSSETPDLFI